MWTLFIVLSVIPGHIQVIQKPFNTKHECDRGMVIVKEKLGKYILFTGCGE